MESIAKACRKLIERIEIRIVIALTVRLHSFRRVHLEAAETLIALC